MLFFVGRQIMVIAAIGVSQGLCHKKAFCTKYCKYVHWGLKIRSLTDKVRGVSIQTKSPHTEALHYVLL